MGNHGIEINERIRPKMVKTLKDDDDDVSTRELIVCSFAAAVLRYSAVIVIAISIKGDNWKML
jgi:hypothetical protein